MPGRVPGLLRAIAMREWQWDEGSSVDYLEGQELFLPLHLATLQEMVGSLVALSLNFHLKV